MRLLPFLLAALSACSTPREIICCGGDEVYILEISDKARKVWSWKAGERPEIPENIRRTFRSTDECKPIDGGKMILVTSSGGGVALVQRNTGKAVFWAYVQNAHSAEVLPGNRVVVAGSTGEKGNRLVVFSLDEPEKEIFSTPLHSGHGVVWDPSRKRLWALGEKELHAYRLSERKDDRPALIRESTHQLPSLGGHDLRAIPGTDRLIVTSNTDVYVFDRGDSTFKPFPGLANMEQVKAVDVHPETGRVVFTTAEERWWAKRIRFLEPPREIPRPGERLYKVRWNR